MSPGIRQLSPEDREAIRSCLVFVAESGDLRGEFSTRMGVDESGVRSIISRWPDVHLAAGSDVVLAVGNALNEVCHGIEIRDDRWSRWFTMTRQDVKSAFRRWRELCRACDRGC